MLSYTEILKYLQLIMIENKLKIVFIEKDLMR